MRKIVIAVCAAFLVSAFNKSAAQDGAVVRQLNAIPELRSLPAYSVVYASLLKAFPCR